jgi:hypothetical protein
MLGRGKEIRIAALFLALFAMVVGVVGIISPDSLTTVGRLYFATPVGLDAAGAMRVAVGLVLILAAPKSRAPKTLRTLGVVVCLQDFHQDAGKSLGLSGCVQATSPHLAQMILEYVISPNWRCSGGIAKTKLPGQSGLVQLVRCAGDMRHCLVYFVSSVNAIAR